MVPTWSQKGSQNGAKIDAKIDLQPKWRLRRARERFGKLEAPFWRPFWSHVGVQHATYRVQLRAGSMQVTAYSIPHATYSIQRVQQTTCSILPREAAEPHHHKYEGAAVDRRMASSINN